MANQGWSVDSFLGDQTSSGANQLPLFLDWLAATCVAACLVAYAPSWMHGPMYFKWLPTGALAVIALFYIRATRASRLDAIDGVALMLLAWVAISLAWSADTLGGRDTLIKWALLTAVFVGMRRCALPDAGKRIALGTALGLIGIMVLDRLGIATYGGYFNQNYETEALLLGLPLLFVLAVGPGPRWRRWMTGLLAIAVVGFLVFLNPSKIEFLGWAGLGLLYVLAALWKKSRLKAIAGAFAILAATGTLAYFGWDRPLLNESHGFRESVYPRLELIANGIAMWRDAPLVGHGAGFMYPTYPLFQEHYLQILGTTHKTALLTSFYTSAGALHNDYVQFLAGFGAVGFVIVLAGLYFGRTTLAQWRNSPARIAGFGVVSTCLMAALVDFPLQNAASSTLAVIGLAWLLPHEPVAEDAGSSPVRHRLAFVPLLLAISALPATGYWMYRYYIGHDAYGEALRIGNTRPDLSLQLNLGAVGAYPLDDAFRYQLYNTLMFMEENAAAPRFPPELNDQIFAAGLTTGPGNALMIFRLEYLLNSGLYKERPEEVAKWRKQLTTNVTRLPDTWLMEGLYEVAYGHPDKAKAALDRYLELTGGVVGEDRKGIVESIRKGIAR